MYLALMGPPLLSLSPTSKLLIDIAQQLAPLHSCQRLDTGFFVLMVSIQRLKRLYRHVLDHPIRLLRYLAAHAGQLSVSCWHAVGCYPALGGGQVVRRYHALCDLHCPLLCDHPAAPSAKALRDVPVLQQRRPRVLLTTSRRSNPLRAVRLCVVKERWASVPGAAVLLCLNPRPACAMAS